MSEQDPGSSIPSADRVELSYAELHSPLFLGGKNHNMKLGDLHGKQKLVYDRAEKELLVSWDGHEAIVPLTNVACMWPRKEAKPIPIEKALPQQAHSRPTAQVETPQSHVFAGPGKGQTGQGGKPK
jgi:hypothetical protein